MTMSATKIRDMVEHDVSTGKRAPGDRLPAVRALAAELEVSPNTVAAAYKQLRNRGVVVGRGRQGTIIAHLARPTLSQVTPVPEGTIDAARGTPDHSLLPPLGDAFAAATAKPPATYGDALLDPSFATAARQMLEADSIDASNIMVTSGAMDAVEKILAANDLRPGDRVGVEDPGHIPVHQLVRMAGLELVPLDIDERGITPNALQDALRQGLEALIVTPRAQNPTGAAHDAVRANELSAILSPHDHVLLIQDDHAGPVSGVDWLPLTAPGPRHATIRSLGKSLGPDLRISIVAGDQATIDRVALAVSNGPGWVSHILQRAAAHLLGDPDASELVNQAAVSYRSRRRLLAERLRNHGIEATGRSGINVWVRCEDEQATVAAARSAGFSIRAADRYRINSEPAVRVTISNLDAEQIRTLADAIAGGPNSTQHSPLM